MYSNDMSWADWSFLLTNKATSLLSDIQAGKYMADKFTAMTYGLTDAQILTLGAFSNKTQADLTNMKYAMGVFTDLYNAMFNGAVETANRVGYLEPFI